VINNLTDKSPAGNIALAIWRGEENILNFLFANRLQFHPTNKVEQ